MAAIFIFVFKGGDFLHLRFVIIFDSLQTRSRLLIRELPSILDGSAKSKALLQDESRATLAPKITSEESWLSFNEKATVLHNKVGQDPEQKFQQLTQKVVSTISLNLKSSQREFMEIVRFEMVERMMCSLRRARWYFHVVGVRHSR
ncbi:hypothetical protein OROMI_000816 [Orobanche minor]